MKARIALFLIVLITLTQAFVATSVQPRRVNKFGLEMIEEMRANDTYSVKDGVTAVKHIPEFRRIWADDVLFSGAILAVVGVWGVLEIRDARRLKKNPSS